MNSTTDKVLLGSFALHGNTDALWISLTELKNLEVQFAA